MAPAAELADLQADWRAQKDLIVKLAEAMPKEKFTYQPTRGNVMRMQLLGTKRPLPFKVEQGPASRPEQKMARASKQELVKMLSDAYDYGSAVLAEQTPESINAIVDKSIPFWGGSTRARLVWLLLSHGNDIYGQMVVYVHLNGIVPPASRGI